MRTISDYYLVTKPGIVKANLFTAIAGYIYISEWQIEKSLLGVTLGTTLVVASGCVMNNILDKRIDRKMARTANRPTVNGRISTKAAFIYGLILLAFGLMSLWYLTNILALTVGIIGFLSYVFVYGYAKRHTNFGTEIGTLPGATPIIAGSLAANPNLSEKNIWLLFLVMVIWQLPHFYAISIYRKDQYKLGGIRVASLYRSFQTLHIHTTITIILFFILTTLIAFNGQVKIIYLAGMTLLSLYWLKPCLKNIESKSDINSFAKKIFMRSLTTLTVWCFLLVVYKFLPF